MYGDTNHWETSKTTEFDFPEGGERGPLEDSRRTGLYRKENFESHCETVESWSLGTSINN